MSNIYVTNIYIIKFTLSKSVVMSEQTQLTIEQKFHLRRLADQTKALSQEQAQELIVELQRQMMVKDNLYKQMIKHEWGI